MKWVIGIAVVLAIVGVLIFLDWKNLEERLETFAADRIHDALHGSGGGGSSGGKGGIGAEFARGVGKKVLNKELGLG